ncbi:hypothetical protein [Planomicrobium sp. CPCC 101079]|uniref:hypothetical protein n=1 Tax=Planomicrobium sp. CPCC 101079 TaxID=2599618 RepID=UPI0016445685|nr:hypothetical protein [Planomicrobium sp. CPCC 101079]
MKTVLLSSIQARFFINVMTETLWTGLAGVAVGAGYMNKFLLKGSSYDDPFLY